MLRVLFRRGWGVVVVWSCVAVCWALLLWALVVIVDGQDMTDVELVVCFEVEVSDDFAVDRDGGICEDG